MTDKMAKRSVTVGAILLALFALAPIGVAQQNQPMIQITSLKGK